MKKLSKILSAVLLLSLVLSAFAVFTAFADSTIKPIVTYDMESNFGKGNGVVNGSGDKAPKDVYDAEGNILGKSLTMNRYVAEDGTPYWQHKTLGAIQNDGTFKVPHSSSNTYVQLAPSTTNANNMVVQDSEKYGKKNMDYMVIDFDISTDGFTSGNFYFHTRWYNAAGNSSQDHYLQINGATLDAFNVQSRSGNAASATAVAAPEGSSNWVGVTAIYDFTSTDSTKWCAYVYIDGVYSGTIKAAKTDAVRFYWMRITPSDTMTEQEATINFANFTVTSFPVGYEGDLVKNAGNLANASYRLSDFEDLAYTSDSPAPLKMATVEREGNTYDIYNVDHLDASLKDGDIVTLERSIYRSIIVPKGANITYNLNGNFMTAPTEVDYESADVVVRDLISNAILGYGKASSDAPAADDGRATPKSLYDMSGYSSPKSITNAKNSGAKYTIKKDSYDRPYWTLSATDATKVVNGEWHATMTEAAIPISNINYFIIDADIKLGENYFHSFDYNVRFRNGTTTVTSNSAAMPAYRVNESGQVGVANGAGKNVKYLDSYDGGEWTSVTFVYDLTSSNYQDWKLHAYIDGQYVGSIATFKNADNLYFCRFEPNAAKSADATTSFANWTVKYYGSDYEGNLGESLGKTDVNLSDILDLKYCVENDYDDIPVVEEESTPDVVTAITSAAATNHTRVTLLNDVEYVTDASFSLKTYNILFDLNGYTLTTKSTKSDAHLFNNAKKLIFRDGSLANVTQTSSNLVAAFNAGSYVAFVDMDSITHTNVNRQMIEQRSGIVRFVNVGSISSTGKNQVVSMRGGAEYLNLEYVNVENMTVDSSLVYVGNTASSSKRYGSLNNNILIVNSNMTTTQSFISIEAYANERGSVSDGVFVPVNGLSGANDNRINLTVIGGSVTAGGAFIKSTVADLANNMYDLDGDGTKEVIWADNFKLNVNANVDSTDIKASTLVENTAASAGVLPEDMVAAGATVVQNTDITLNTTSIDLVSDAMVTKTDAASYATASVSIYGETAISTDKVCEDGAEGITLTLDSSLYFVPRSNPDALAYALTSNVKAYPYILGEDEYEFYWYNGDAVTVDKIPVELPSGSGYVKYEWAPTTDINGAYYTIMTVNLPVKANLTLYSDFTFNLYLPTDLGDDCYANILVNGSKATVTPVVKDGVEYMMISVEGISPAVAAEDISVELTLSGIKVEKKVSVLGYVEAIFDNENAPAKDTKLAASLLNYIDKAYTALDKTNEKLDALTDSDAYKAVVLEKTTAPEAKSSVSDLGIFSEVGLYLADDFRYIFKTSDTFEGNIIVTYYKDGVKVMETRRMKAGEELVLELKARDLLADITFRYAGNEGTFNLAAYVEKVKAIETVDQSTLDLLDALWIYSECAAEYKAN